MRRRADVRRHRSAEEQHHFLPGQRGSVPEHSCRDSSGDPLLIRPSNRGICPVVRVGGSVGESVVSSWTPDRRSLRPVQEGDHLLAGERSNAAELIGADAAGDSLLDCPSDGEVRPVISRKINERVASLGTRAASNRIKRPAEKGHHLVAGKSLSQAEAVVAHPGGYTVSRGPVDGSFSDVTCRHVLKVGCGLSHGKANSERKAKESRCQTRYCFFADGYQSCSTLFSPLSWHRGGSRPIE